MEHRRKQEHFDFSNLLQMSYQTKLKYAQRLENLQKILAVFLLPVHRDFSKIL